MIRRQFQVILEENNAVMTEFGFGGLPWGLVVIATIMIFFSPIVVSIQTTRMLYNYFYNPVEKKEKTVEEDKDFVRAKPKKQAAVEEAKQEE